MASVAHLRIYPVKSCRGIELDAARIGPRGFEWDRSWMVVDERGHFLTQRTHPLLARVQPSIERDALVLRAPGLDALAVPLAPEGEPREVVVWRDRCTGLDQGDAAAAWFGEVLADRVRLVRQAPSDGRAANREFTGTVHSPVAFPDGYPILVTSAASLEDLNARMPAPIPMERFRPNIVVEGWPAWAEDAIDTVHVGAARLRLVKPCVRCVIPSTDQETGERSIDPLPVLKGFRFDRKLLGVTFGENAIVLEGEGGQIVRGETVRADPAPP